MITLLHLLSYVGGLAAFLFITLSLGASLRPSPPSTSRSARVDAGNTILLNGES
jgi:hypothetical protein